MQLNFGNIDHFDKWLIEMLVTLFLLGLIDKMQHSSVRLQQTAICAITIIITFIMACHIDKCWRLKKRYKTTIINEVQNWDCYKSDSGYHPFVEISFYQSHTSDISDITLVIWTPDVRTYQIGLQQK